MSDRQVFIFVYMREYLWYTPCFNIFAKNMDTLILKQLSISYIPNKLYSWVKGCYIPDFGIFWHIMHVASVLTHWGRVTHICIGNLSIIGSYNGLLPGQRQAIIWINAGILLIGPSGTNFSEILIVIKHFHWTKTHLKMLSGKRRTSCLGLNVLKDITHNFPECSVLWLRTLSLLPNLPFLVNFLRPWILMVLFLRWLIQCQVFPTQTCIMSSEQYMLATGCFGHCTGISVHLSSRVCRRSLRFCYGSYMLWTPCPNRIPNTASVMHETMPSVNCMKKSAWSVSTRTTRTPAFWEYPPPPHDYPYYWFISDPKSKKIWKECKQNCRFFSRWKPKNLPKI